MYYFIIYIQKIKFKYSQIFNSLTILNRNIYKYFLLLNNYFLVNEFKTHFGNLSETNRNRKLRMAIIHILYNTK